MRKISFITLCCLLFSLMPIPRSSAPVGGGAARRNAAEAAPWNGVTFGEPVWYAAQNRYEIGDAAQLAGVRNWINAGQSWEPIGIIQPDISDKSFSRVFDGDGFKIRDFKIETPPHTVNTDSSAPSGCAAALPRQSEISKSWILHRHRRGCARKYRLRRARR